MAEILHYSEGDSRQGFNLVRVQIYFLHNNEANVLQLAH